MSDDRPSTGGRPEVPGVSNKGSDKPNLEAADEIAGPPAPESLTTANARSEPLQSAVGPLESSTGSESRCSGSPIDATSREGERGKSANIRLVLKRPALTQTATKASSVYVVFEGDPGLTVGDVKQRLGEVTNLAPDQQIFLRRGRALADSAVLATLGLGDFESIYFVKKRVTSGGSPLATPNQGSLEAGGAVEGSTTTQAPLAAGAGPAPEAPASTPLGGVMQLLDSPWLQHCLEQPELVHAVLDADPHLRELRRQNPELNMVLNDPQIWRQSMEALRNPQLLNEMMRSTDRALSNMESMPGGHDAIRRMYHTIQEPLWDSLLQRRAQEPGAGSQTHYELHRDGPPSAEVVPNPWAPRAPNGTTHPVNAPPPSPAAAVPPVPALRPENFRDLLNQYALRIAPGSSGALSSAPAHLNPTPAPDYASQADQLRGMGFTDDAAILRALQLAGGDVNMAVHILFGGGQ